MLLSKFFSKKKRLRVISKKNKSFILEDIILAKSLDDRIKGLMFKNKMPGYNGILLDPCNSIHTCFVHFPIDVIFLDKNNKVLEVIRSMKPWRLSKIYWKAKKVLEVKGGTLPISLSKGEEVEIICTN